MRLRRARHAIEKLVSSAADLSGLRSVNKFSHRDVATRSEPRNGRTGLTTLASIPHISFFAFLAMITFCTGYAVITLDPGRSGNSGNSIFSFVTFCTGGASQGKFKDRFVTTRDRFLAVKINAHSRVGR